MQDMEGTQEIGQATDMKTLGYFKECLQWCADDFSVTINALCSGDNEKRTKVVSKEDHMKIRRPLDSPFQIVVLGQTNSGKSSVINEILGGDFLPTSDLPCTKLPIKLVFSERGKEFQQLVNGKGEVMQTCALRKKRRVQMSDYVTFIEESALDGTRDQLIVKAGLNHELLKNGVELIDTPGVGQSEDLDRVIHGVTEGIFQLFLYVIDGNYGVRKEDRDLLDDLRRQRPDAPFFFVCNKVDVFSGELDTLSDEEEREAAPVDMTKDSKVRQQLIELGILAQEKADDPRGVYHGISTRQVRKARKRKKDSEFTGTFNTMKECLFGVIKGTIQTYLRESLLILDKLQTSLIISHLRTESSAYTNSPKGTAVIDTFQQALYHSLEGIAKQTENSAVQELRRLKPDVLDAAASMKFASISVGAEIRRDEVIRQCTKQIRNLLVSRTMKIITVVEDKIRKQFHEEVRMKLEQFDGDYGGMPGLHDAVASFVRRQSEHCYCGTNKVTSYNFFYGQQGILSAIKHFLSTAKAIRITTGDGFVNVGSDWKREVASDVWQQLDLGRVSYELQAEILNQLKTSRNALRENIKKSLSAEAMNDENGRQQLADLVSQIALESCETLSLLNQLDYGPVQLVQDGAKCPVPIYIGRSTKTRECNPWGTRVLEPCTITTVSKNAMETKEKQVQQPPYDTAVEATEETTQVTSEAANVPPTRQVSSGVKAPSMASKSFLRWNRRLAIQLCRDRFTPRHLNILPWIGPALLLEGGVWQRGIVTRAYHKSLYTILSCGEPLDFPYCLKIAMEICDAGEDLHSIGQQFNDLRVTNVLLDNNGQVKINNLGLRNDSVPYPDGQPPFHIAPEDYNTRSSGRTCDIYAFGILLWFMCIGKYKRPEYATGTSEQIRKAVQQGERPRLMSKQDTAKYLNIVKDCWAMKREDRSNFASLKAKLKEAQSHAQPESEQEASPKT